MFKLAASPVYWQTIETEVTGENGVRTAVKFDIQFKRLSSDQHKELAARIPAESMNDADIAREVVVGWRGVADEENNQIEFSAENFDKMLQLGFATSIVVHFFRSYPKARQKN